jgi:hypothetical protein
MTVYKGAGRSCCGSRRRDRGRQGRASRSRRPRGPDGKKKEKAILIAPTRSPKTNYDALQDKFLKKAVTVGASPILQVE